MERPCKTLKMEPLTIDIAQWKLYPHERSRGLKLSHVLFQLVQHLTMGVGLEKLNTPRVYHVIPRL